MFEKNVRTPNGNVKRVMAASEAELAEAVEAAQNETAQVTPNIDNPDHGNMRVTDFVNGKETPLEQRAENLPTSESSKRVAKELADVPRSERAEVLRDFEADADDRDIVEMPEREKESEDESTEKAESKDRKSAPQAKESDKEVVDQKKTTK
jgi:hypothetical protein